MSLSPQTVESLVFMSDVVAAVFLHISTLAILFIRAVLSATEQLWPEHPGQMWLVRRSDELMKDL